MGDRTEVQAEIDALEADIERLEERLGELEDPDERHRILEQIKAKRTQWEFLEFDLMRGFR